MFREQNDRKCLDQLGNQRKSNQKKERISIMIVYKYHFFLDMNGTDTIVFTNEQNSLL